MPFVIGTLNSTQVVGLLLSKYLREVAFPSPVQRQFLGRRPTASPARSISSALPHGAWRYSLAASRSLLASDLVDDELRQLDAAVVDVHGACRQVNHHIVRYRHRALA